MKIWKLNKKEEKYACSIVALDQTLLYFIFFFFAKFSGQAKKETENMMLTSKK